MTSLIILFNVAKKMSWKKTTHSECQSAIVKKCPNNVFKLKLSSSFENSGNTFRLKEFNQSELRTYAVGTARAMSAT